MGRRGEPRGELSRLRGHACTESRMLLRGLMAHALQAEQVGIETEPAATGQLA